MNDYPETKADRREKKRNKNRFSHVGVPFSKVRMTTEEEFKYRLHKKQQEKQLKKKRRSKQKYYDPEL